MVMPRTTNAISSFLTVVFLISSMASIAGHDHRPWPPLLREFHGSELAAMVRLDADAAERASTDFGRLVRAVPAAVFYPSSARDVAALVQLSYASAGARRFTIAPRGSGHSVHGQALAPGGVVVEMGAMREAAGAARVRVFRGPSLSYVDAGGEQLWIDVLRETLKRGLAPRSWTDYLYLTVGGTLSNAGISGQAFRCGPQISNVYELDIINGKGEMVTCSERQEPDLFFAALGGLGQFGIITRARIALEPAPKMVRWIRLIYTDFGAFTEDQEKLISHHDHQKGSFNYVEGSLLMEHSLTNNWRSSFYSEEDITRIRALAAQHGAVYCLEAAKYVYGHAAKSSVHQEVESLVRDLSFVEGFLFRNDVTYVNFLNRVREGELKLRSRGLWDVPHPWLNIFVPRSRIHDFDRGVFKRILRRNGSVGGPILVYPLNRNKWDDRTSAVVPDEEEVFYTVGLLRCGAMDEWEHLEEQNMEILRFCDESGIGYKQYLPHYRTRGEWVKHFGRKWHKFAERKKKYDPRAILSPGQMIFTAPVNSL